MEHLDSFCPQGVSWYKLICSRRGLTLTNGPKLNQSKHTVCEYVLSENVIRCYFGIPKCAGRTPLGRMLKRIAGTRAEKNWTNNVKYGFASWKYRHCEPKHRCSFSCTKSGHRI